MKITDNFVKMSPLYIDSAPLIYYIEETPKYVKHMDVIFQLLSRTSTQAITSVIILTEVLNKPMQLGKTELVNAYRNILISNSAFQLHLVDSNVAERAAELRAQYNLRTPDALHMATALVSGCKSFLTNDKSLNRVSDISVLILDELSI